jgi:hypothetical protein
MKVLIIPNSEISKFPIKYKGGQWNPTNNTVSGEYWLQLESEQDLIDNGISYTIGEVEIKQETE